MNAGPVARWTRDRLKATGKKYCRILDAGCGTGILSMKLLRLIPEAQIVATDISASRLALAKERSMSVGLDARIVFTKDSVQAMIFPDNSFDAVVCVDVLGELEKPSLALSEIERVLKPEGHFCVTCGRKGYLLALVAPRMCVFSPSEIQELASQSNLRPWALRSSLTRLMITDSTLPHVPPRQKTT